MTDIYGQKGTSYKDEEEEQSEVEEYPPQGKNIRFSGTQLTAIQRAIGVEDQIWAELSAEVAQIVDRSNIAYGDSTERSARMLGILYPDGIQPEQMHDARCVISILDKISRIATDKDAFGESPWRDVAGYALLAYRHDLNRNLDRDR